MLVMGENGTPYALPSGATIRLEVQLDISPSPGSLTALTCPSSTTRVNPPCHQCPPEKASAACSWSTWTPLFPHSSPGTSTTLLLRLRFPRSTSRLSKLWEGRYWDSGDEQWGSRRLIEHSVHEGAQQAQTAHHSLVTRRSGDKPASRDPPHRPNICTQTCWTGGAAR